MGSKVEYEFFTKKGFRLRPVRNGWSSRQVEVLCGRAALGAERVDRACVRALAFGSRQVPPPKRRGFTYLHKGESKLFTS